MADNYKQWLRYLDKMEKFGGFSYDLKNKRRTAHDITAYMLARTLRMFEYTGLPETIPARELELQLQTAGFSVITEYQGDLYAFIGGLGGVPDEYYRPTVCIVNNPYFRYNKELRIDRDCVLIRNDSVLYGLLPLYGKYSYLMSENELTMKIADINMRIPALISAQDDRTRASAEKILRDVESGESGIIGESALLDALKVSPYGSVATARNLSELVEFEQYLKASLYNEIGLDANYNMKRESLSMAESQMNDDALFPLVDDMLKSRKEALKRVKEMYGIEITVELSGAWKRNAQELQAAPVADPEPTKTEGGDNEGESENAE